MTRRNRSDVGAQLRRILLAASSPGLDDMRAYWRNYERIDHSIGRLDHIELEEVLERTQKGLRDILEELLGS